MSFKLGPRRGCVRAASALEWYERGCALEASDPDAAALAYGSALAGRPDLADAHNNLGRLHHDRGRLADAEACYRRAVRVDADVALYWFNLGVALEDAHRSAEAIVAYERSIALDARMADAHFNLARQLEQAGRRGPMIDELVMRRAVRHLKQYRALVKLGAR